jgi:hypothetical protein
MKRTYLIALVLAGQMLAASAAGVLVLCLGADGHVAVETADASQRCADLPSPHQGTSELPRWAVDDDCGPCNDVGLLRPVLAGSSEKTKAAGPDGLRLPLASTQPLTGPVGVALSLPGDTPVAVSLRSIVLLV